MFELQAGEFYGQLVDSNFSNFKAQIKAPQPELLPEIVPVMTATNQAIKKNFIRIQKEIEALLAIQRPGQGKAAEPTTPSLLRPYPSTVRPGILARV